MAKGLGYPLMEYGAMTNKRLHWEHLLWNVFGMFLEGLCLCSKPAGHAAR